MRLNVGSSAAEEPDRASGATTPSASAKSGTGSRGPALFGTGSSPTGHPEEPAAPQPVTRQIVVQKRTFVQDRPAAYSVAGAGMPVVLLHGWGLADHTYRGVIASIASHGCRVIAPALPGFGGTRDLPKQDFSIAGYGRWVADLLQALDVDEPAVVVGHSFGGGVSIRLAHDHPKRVRSMVLVNSIGGSSWRQGSVVRSIAERPLWDWGLHFPSDVWPIRQATRVLPVIIEDFIPNLLRNPRAIAKVSGLARRADLRTELEDLRKSGMPITILWASRDGIIPRESFEALCVAAGVQGTVVDGSHSWLLADPDQFGEVITNDVRIAKMARELELQVPAKKRRGIRRVKSLLPKMGGSTADQPGPADS